MNYAGITSANNDDIVCKFGNAVNQTTNAAINGYKFYICIIPISDATSPPNTWSGTLRVGGLPTNSNYYVCRFQYNNTDLDNNSRNIQPYSGVEKSLDGQNFYIMTGANNAGCGEPTDPGNAITSVLHQNCRPNGTAGECPAASPNNYTS